MSDKLTKESVRLHLDTIQILSKLEQETMDAMAHYRADALEDWQPYHRIVCLLRDAIQAEKAIVEGGFVPQQKWDEWERAAKRKKR